MGGSCAWDDSGTEDEAVGLIAGLLLSLQTEGARGTEGNSWYRLLRDGPDMRNLYDHSIDHDTSWPRLGSHKGGPKGMHNDSRNA